MISSSTSFSLSNNIKSRVPVLLLVILNGASKSCKISWLYQNLSSRVLNEFRDFAVFRFICTYLQIHYTQSILYCYQVSITLLSCLFDITITLSCILHLTLSIYVIYLSNMSVLSRGFRARTCAHVPNAFPLVITYNMHTLFE